MSMLRRAFTLIELLVVIGIIALLVGILMPTLAAARKSADRTACRASLRDIGAQLQMYFNDSKNKLPRVNTIPSVQPPINDAPSIIKLLEPYHRGSVKVFRCPADRILEESPGAPAGYMTYFEREGSSYQYNPMLAAMHAGEQLKDTRLFQLGRPELVILMSDYEPFHGAKGTNGSMNHLFADMHVGDLLGN
jgi:prepilin-type N-terminal cleavage/methylation domain-containing protein